MKTITDEKMLELLEKWKKGEGSAPYEEAKAVYGMDYVKNIPKLDQLEGVPSKLFKPVYDKACLLNRGALGCELKQYARYIHVIETEKIALHFAKKYELKGPALSLLAIAIRLMSLGRNQSFYDLDPDPALRALRHQYHALRTIISSEILKRTPLDDDENEEDEYLDEINSGYILFLVGTQANIKETDWTDDKELREILHPIFLYRMDDIVSEFNPMAETADLMWHCMTKASTIDNNFQGAWFCDKDAEGNYYADMPKFQKQLTGWKLDEETGEPLPFIPILAERAVKEIEERKTVRYLEAMEEIKDKTVGHYAYGIQILVYLAWAFRYDKDDLSIVITDDYNVFRSQFEYLETKFKEFNVSEEEWSLLNRVKYAMITFFIENGFDGEKIVNG